MTTSAASNFDRISPTALLTAYARQFSDIPYTQEIAELTNAAATVNQFMGKEQENPITIGLAALVEARYKAIEQVRTQFGGTQILELASGLLPRGVIQSRNPGITFIESDLPGMIHQKQQLVQQLISDRSNLHFLAINAVTDLDSSLLSDYFQPDQPVTILCEGLLMYLSFAEKQQVFANVREILQTFGGVWITPDLNTKVGAEQMGKNGPAFQPVNQKITSSTGRLFVENEFDDLDHVTRFIQAQGFQSEAVSMLTVADQLRCLSKLHIDSERVQAMLAALPVFVLKLAKV
ncbi:MAG: class I SAM-dependent methyltransferase [Leptolyngbya sp. BL-A-14]